MGELTTVKGKDVKEQMESIDATLRRVSSRVPVKQTFILTPPVPFSTYAEVVRLNDKVFAFFFPFKGILKDMYLQVGDKAVKNATFRVSLQSVTKTEQDFVVTMGLKQTLNWPITGGDKIICTLLSIVPADDKALPLESMTEVWSAFVCEVDKSEMNREQIVTEV
jgi:hypothetical protein